MTSLPTYNSLTLAPPRITYEKFLSLLKSKNSPAVPEALSIWNVLITEGVDPSYMLAQYRVESQYGTSGHALVTKSIGNMLWDASLCIHAIGKYAPGNGFTYAKYNNHTDAAKDYARYLHDYAENRNKPDIYSATSEWIGKPEGSPGHFSYVTIVINDMIEYEIQPGEFVDTGDGMIYAGPAFDRATGRVIQKYPVNNNTILYRGPNDDLVLKKYSGATGDAWWLGPVNGSYDWGAIFIGTSLADADATLLYIKKPVKSRIKNV